MFFNSSLRKTHISGFFAPSLESARRSTSRPVLKIDRLPAVASIAKAINDEIPCHALAEV